MDTDDLFIQSWCICHGCRCDVTSACPICRPAPPSSPQAIPPPAPLCQTTVGCWVHQMTGHLEEGFSRQAMMEEKEASRADRSGVVEYSGWWSCGGGVDDLIWK